jgi:hypothetical protein
VDFEKFGFFKKMYYLTVAIYHASKENIIIPLCFVGVTIIRLVFVLFNTFLLLWITSFVDKGVLKDENEAKNII